MKASWLPVALGLLKEEEDALHHSSSSSKLELPKELPRGHSEKLINLDWLKEQQQKNQCCCSSPKIKLPEEFPSVEETLMTLSAALASLDTLDWNDILRLRCIIAGAKECPSGTNESHIIKKIPLKETLIKRAELECRSQIVWASRSVWHDRHVGIVEVAGSNPASSTKHLF